MQHRSHQPCDPRTIARVARLVSETSLHDAARMLGINHHTVQRVLAGLPVLAGTRAAIEMSISR